MIDLNRTVSTPDYRFLRENEHLGSSIMFITFGGSHAYGTADAFSDVDVRGCALNTASDLLGLSVFDTFRDKQTDTTINSLFKTVQQLLKGDLAAAELLGCKKEHYTMVSAAGAQFLQQRSLFLTQALTSSYAGYIYAMENWLKTASARLHLGKQCSEKTVLESCKKTVEKFNKLYDEDGVGVSLCVDSSEKDGMSVEVYMDASFRKRPLRDCFAAISAMQNIVAVQEASAENRRILDDRFVSKKMCTLLRQLYTCCELAETGRLVTYREAEHDALLEVRGGKYLNRQSLGIAPEYWQLVESLKDRMEYARKNTVLPASPDMAAINQLVMDLNRQVLA